MLWPLAGIQEQRIMIMNSSFFLSVTTFVYGLAALLYIIAWIFQKRVIGARNECADSLFVARKRERA